MKLERKIELQNKIIDRLENEKTELQEKCNELQSKLDIIKISTNDFDKTNEFVEDIQPLIDQLKQAIKDAKEAKEKYDEVFKLLYTTKAKYENEMNTLLFSFTKEQKKLKKKNIIN